MWYSIIGRSKEVIIEPVVLESFFPHKLTGRWRENQPGGSQLQKEPKTPKVPQRLPSLDFPRAEPIPNPNFQFFSFVKFIFPNSFHFLLFPGLKNTTPTNLSSKDTTSHSFSLVFSTLGLLFHVSIFSCPFFVLCTFDVFTTRFMHFNNLFLLSFLI